MELPAQVQPTVVFYDDVCTVCNGLVNFVVHSRHAERFRFAPLKLLPLSGNSVLVLEAGQVFSKSHAIFAIFSRLGFPWVLLTVFKLFPGPLLDRFYDAFARNRFRLFGRVKNQGACELVEPKLRHLFWTTLPDSLLLPRSLLSKA